MNRGPVTHAFLGSKALRVGFSQPYDDAVWNSEMVSADSTVEMIVERVLFNFERAPQGLRKSAGADVAGLMQKLCRSFEVYCELLKQRVGEAPGVSVKSWFCYCSVSEACVVCDAQSMLRNTAAMGRPSSMKSTMASSATSGAVSTMTC